MKPKIYNVCVSTPLGRFYVAVESMKDDAKQDARAAIRGNFHIAMIKVESEPMIISRRSLAAYEPIPNATSGGIQWAWQRPA